MAIEVISKVELIKDVELPKRVDIDFAVRTYETFDLGEDKIRYFSTYEEALKFYNEVSDKFPTQMEIFIEVFDNEGYGELETMELCKNYKVTETRELKI